MGFLLGGGLTFSPVIFKRFGGGALTFSPANFKRIFKCWFSTYWHCGLFGKYLHVGVALLRSGILHMSIWTITMATLLIFQTCHS